MDALRLDGNAAAGILGELFTTEMTTAIGRCGSCGAVDAVGAVHVYVAAGIVLRCPHCDGVLMRIVQHESRVWLDLSGLGSLELHV
jgi:hypothetical protein